MKKLVGLLPLILRHVKNNVTEPVLGSLFTQYNIKKQRCLKTYINGVPHLKEKKQTNITHSNYYVFVQTLMTSDQLCVEI